MMGCLSIDFRVSQSEAISKFVFNILSIAGFVSNREKPKWNLTKILTWIGISVNLNKGYLYISEESISNHLETIGYITNYPHTSAQTPAKLADKIISIKSA